MGCRTASRKSALNWSCSSFPSTTELTTPITMRKHAVRAIRPASRRERSDSDRRGAVAWAVTGLPRWSRVRAEAVADAALSVDQWRSQRVQLAPQIAHVRLEHLRLPGVLPAPDVLEQLLAGKHQPLVAHQVGEQPELGWRQLDEYAAPPDGPVVLVEFQVADPQRRRVVSVGVAVPGLVHARAAQHRAHPGHQRLDGERLRDVVVAAEGEAGDGIRRRV